MECPDLPGCNRGAFNWEDLEIRKTEQRCEIIHEGIVQD